MKRWNGILAVFALLALTAAPPAGADDREDMEAGIPAYSVARVKVLAGSVWVRSMDEGEWQEYPGNSPLPPRSRISVPSGSEAELQFHGSQFVLLTSGTDVDVRDLQEGRTSFRLRAGEIRFDLPREDFAPVLVRLPGGSRARFPEPGRYWLTVTDVDESQLVVRRGTASVTRDDEEYRLRSGEVATIGGDVTIRPYRGREEEYAAPPPLPDSERVADLPPVVVSELQDYGEWVSVPTYGYVWRPRVATGWSPYVYGRWVWISPYGWTWVSNEPWGWYPYRCGYWVADPAFGWVWSPFDTFVSVNFAFGSSRHHFHDVFFFPSRVRFVPEGGNVRWVPLRPGERFRPAEFRRGDARLAGWNRSLEGGRVFTRAGQDRREWRDYAVVAAERQAATRQAIAAQARPDTRGVRPELNRGRPPERGRERGAPPPGVRTPPSRNSQGGPAAPGRSGNERRPETRGTVAPRGNGTPRGAVAPRETVEPGGTVAPRGGGRPQSVAPARPPAREPEAAPREVGRPAPDAVERGGRERVPAVRPPARESPGREIRGDRGEGGGRGEPEGWRGGEGGRGR